ncbi:flagellar FliL protein [Desulfosalsimonas propionicica]|uniref:Flagellar protein FliL n=1 Tax=Desulfosalsimonas propionicica TaxID=332175 RepID=A0A7W0C8V2_9BACT|nr:flagellar basal body-associated FliL family protein [Desulfosalsimonas propionicica]MBA2881308.1 flagellar FliL protein [Desulfosalsimonas propionicica]
MAKEKEKQAPEKTASPVKRLLFIGVPVLLILLVAAGTGFYLLGALNTTGSAEARQSDTGRDKTELGPLVEMDDFVVNIVHRDSTRFLKVGITLEVRDKTSSESVKKRIPQITDSVLLLLGNRKYDDVKDLQGKMQLKADLLAKIRSLAGKGEVTNLYFTDFVVQ